MKILLIILSALFTTGCVTRELWNDSDRVKYIIISRSLAGDEIKQALDVRFGKSIGMSPDGSQIIYKMNEKWYRIVSKYTLTAPAVVADIGVGVVTFGVSAPATMLQVVRDEEFNVASLISQEALLALVNLAGAVK